MKKKTCGIGFFSLSIIFLLFATYFSITKTSLWYDSIYSFHLIKFPVNQIINLTAGDVHPPLYYLIYKFFNEIAILFSINNPILVGLFVSLLPFYLLFIIALLKVRKLFGWLTTGLFTLTLIAMPQMMNYAFEIRMYSWALFFITTSFIIAYDILKNNNTKLNWALITILTIASAYTHYFSAIASSLIYLYLLIYLLKNKINLKKWFLSVIIIILAYVPWIPILLEQITVKTSSYWIAPITLNRVIGYIFFVFSPEGLFVYGNEIISFSILGILLLIAVLFLIIKNNHDFDSKYGIIGILICFLVPTSGVLISILLRPFFHPRYMVPVLGILWLGVSILLSKQFDKKYIFIPIAILIILVSITGSITFYENLDHRQEVTTNISHILDEKIGNDNILICCQYCMYRDLSTYLLVDNTYLLCEYFDNNSFSTKLDSVLSNLSHDKDIYVVNLQINNNISLDYDNYYLTEVPLNITEAIIYPDYNKLHVYKVNFKE